MLCDIGLAALEPPLQDRLALVSSLYGPGTITGWYLTILSLMASWTLHPRKRKSGSVDVELLAVLTLPAVAACHSISQARRIRHQENHLMANDGAGWYYVQSLAALEASFTVTETFMAISVIFFIVAAWMFCIRRAILVGAVGLLCFAIECFLHFTGFMDHDCQDDSHSSPDTYPAFRRMFVANFAGLVIALLAILAVCGVISAAVAICMLSPSRLPSSSAPQDHDQLNQTSAMERASPNHPATRSITNVQKGREALQDRSLRSITMITTLFLPASFVTSLLPLFWHDRRYYSMKSTAESTWQFLVQCTARLLQNLFPRTALHITDLDQAVAAAAGASGFGFTLYSVTKSYYIKWKAKNSASSGPSSTDLDSIVS